MGILGGEGFSPPVVSETEVVDVKLSFTDKAIRALEQNMNGDEDTHVLHDARNPEDAQGIFTT